jgi:hypothetical protein
MDMNNMDDAPVPVPAPVRFCKDCRFFDVTRHGSLDLAQCSHPSALYENRLYLVLGGEPKNRLFCTTHRMGEPSSTSCGTPGIYFEPAAKAPF